MSARRGARRPHVALFLKNERGGIAGRRMHLADALLRRGCRVDVLTVWLRHGSDGIPAGARSYSWRHHCETGRSYRGITWRPGARSLSCGASAARTTVATTPPNVAAVSARYLARSPVRLVISQHNPVSETIAQAIPKRAGDGPFGQEVLSGRGCRHRRFDRHRRRSGAGH